MQRPHPTGLTLAPAGEGDFEALLALRMAAMRESLERVGHFDPQRVRERLSRGYLPAHTRHILKDGELVGFVVVQPRENRLAARPPVHPPVGAGARHRLLGARGGADGGRRHAARRSR